MNGGEKLSLTQQFNIVKKLRDLGAVRVQVGDIAADFEAQPTHEIVIEEPDSETLVNDREELDATRKWYRSSN